MIDMQALETMRLDFNTNLLKLKSKVNLRSRTIEIPGFLSLNDTSGLE